MRMIRMSRYLILFAFLMAGCCSMLPTPQNPTAEHATACSDKACFIAAANDCNSTNITVKEDFGVMHYETSTDCAFTKTMVKLDDNESQEMKNLLEGKNMTCVYAKGSFDPRLVNSLIEGTENCTGELKVDLARLAVFT